MNALNIIESLISKVECEHRPTVCYKFWTVKEWEERKSLDNMAGSDFDKKDGFIHMCTIDQCKTIANRYFANQSQYFIVKMDLKQMKKIQWDTNKHGTFPHSYMDFPKE
eukprot:172299_1